MFYVPLQLDGTTFSSSKRRALPKKRILFAGLEPITNSSAVVVVGRQLAAVQQLEVHDVISTKLRCARR